MNKFNSVKPNNLLSISTITKTNSGIHPLYNQEYQRKISITVPIQSKNIFDIYKQWLIETKRNGGVLIGSSIKEFFEYFNNYEKVNNMA